MAVEKRNILLSNVTEAQAYKSSSHPVTKKYPSRTNAVSHASSISHQLQNCKSQSVTQKQAAAIKYKEGMYLEFSGEKNYELATKSLENRTQGIRLLNIRTEDETVKATVYVPEGKESYFLKKVADYEGEDRTAKGNRKNEDLVSSIENIKLAMLDSFWTDKPELIPTDQIVRCEVWFRYEVKSARNADKTPWITVEKAVSDICNEQGIRIEDKMIRFPDRFVKLIYANQEQLKILLTTCEYVTEIRRAEEPNLFFKDLSVSEQHQWIDELLQRTTYEKGKVAVCLLDAGINGGHPLLNPAIESRHVQSVDPSWGVLDNANYNGHGSEMAGIILFRDLKDALISSEPVLVPHELESVKILPPQGQNPEHLYGYITQQAVSLAEIANADSQRVICMPVTADNEEYHDGRPTSWSAAIDSITAAADEEADKRLFIISAGNVEPADMAEVGYPETNQLHGIENPGQSWNAITVGGYSDCIEIQDKAFNGFQAVAKRGELSPFSSTSLAWKRQWPVKPDVLFDAGNMASNSQDYDTSEDLLLLTTSHRNVGNQFSYIWGTSSASAQASWFCAQLMNEYPQYWPETIRALVIHSAEWTEAMKQQFCSDDSTKSNIRNLLRTCGYGIPNLNTAIQCANNSVNMIIQGELQPYGKTKGSSISMNEMHLHTLPWPNDLLRDLGSTKVRIKVTLSYFIEPSPGAVGWKDRYRYPSCGLRFKIKDANQSLDAFVKSINVGMRDEDEEVENGNGLPWYIGPNNRNTGSIHSDFADMNAVDLCDCNYIAVYPVGGWWKERSYLNKWDKKVRYSLILSISTPENDVDLYTPIITQVKIPVEIQIPV